jgi:gamma-glutamylputrescine oxidase
VPSCNHAPSYYAATANSYAAHDALQAHVQADVVVIGAGFTGLSAALHLAEQGQSVIVLESHRIGWGASGRNGGQLIPGLRKGAVDLVKMLGAGQAKALFTLALEAIDAVQHRIQRHDIKCDFKKSGHLLAAVKQRDLDWMREEAACLASIMDYHDAEIIDKNRIGMLVRGGNYQGGLLDRRGGHLHPLNYAIGLGIAAAAAGVQIFEHSHVVSLENGADIKATTLSGSVRAKYGVLACDAYLGKAYPPVSKYMMPVGNYIIATEPLANWEEIIPADLPVSDSNFVLDYYRLSADKRLLFSGGEKYTATPPADIAAFVAPHMHKVFPALRDARIDYAWGGMVSVTRSRLPHFGQDKALFHAQGYSGQGVALTTLAGRLIADAIAGNSEQFDVFSRIKPDAFPGGDMLRNPLYVIGMLWYALRDRV